METFRSSDSTVEYTYLKECVDEFIVATADGRALSERCRDYYDGKQWTEEQIKKLKKRKQAPIVNNRIKVKHNGLLGLVSLRRGDPKALPRNVKTDSSAAEACTDGLRYVADKCKLNTTFLTAADNFFCEGYCGVHITAEDAPDGSIQIIVEHIPWERIFFDAFSQKNDFSDSRGKGFLMWMDEEDILDAFPDASETVLNSPDITNTDTFSDKPLWFARHGKRKRHLVATHYYKQRGAWKLAIYTGGGYLLAPMDSPYTNEYGAPECPLEFEHAYIDRQGQRYGELASFLDLQDEINHRRSKALFLLSQRQTYGSRGAIKDVKKAKSELAKGDGHLEVGQGEFGKDFGILPTGDMAAGQLELLKEAKEEIDSQSFSAQLAGERQSSELSGVALKRLQSAGLIELNRLFENFGSFKLRVYRQIWNRIRQYWTEEMWVRVTDDHKKLRWVGFNVPVPMGKFLQETMDDDSKPHAMRLGASAKMIELEQLAPEALQQVIMVKNRPAELDMDLILDESFDVINASEEQLDAILRIGAGNEFDIIDLLEISNIQGKDKLIDRINRRRQEAAEAQAEGAGKDPQSQYLTAKAAEAAANVKVKEQDAQQTAIENEMLTQQSGVVFKGSVSA